MLSASSIFSDLVDDYTLRTIAVGAAAIGVVAGALGSFAFLRRQSLLGDAVSHAALPGIALAFILSGSKDAWTLTFGALAAGVLGALLVLAVVSGSRVRYDSALGVVLAGFFGLGLLLLTFIQNRPDAAQAGLDRFLFGQAAALLEEDLYVVGAFGGVALVIMALLWKEFKLLSFDPAFGATLGLPIRLLDVVLTGTLVVAIVVGLQTVGVVLMSALVVAPAAAARQWTDRLGLMVALSASFGAFSGVLGAVASSRVERLPTGPSIVVVVSVLAFLSLAFAPRRGLVWRAVADARSRRRLRLTAVLLELARLEGESGRAHEARVVGLALGDRHDAFHSLRELKRRGLVSEDDGWRLTARGRRIAEDEGLERGGRG